jgi:hypothetical protein
LPLGNVTSSGFAVRAEAFRFDTNAAIKNSRDAMITVVTFFQARLTNAL